MAQDFEVKVPLNVGVDESSLAEAVQPGALAVSRNTRLTKLRGTVTKSPGSTSLLGLSFIDSGGVTPATGIHGALPLSTGSSTSVMFRPAIGPQYVVDNIGYPASAREFCSELEQTFAPTGGLSHSAPALAIDASGNIWSASVQLEQGDFKLYVSIRKSDGTPVLSQQLVATPKSTYTSTDVGLGQWCALTVHGSTVTVWWKAVNSGAGTEVYSYANATLSGGVLNIGATSTVGGGSSTRRIARRPDVVYDATNAYLCICDTPAGSATALTIFRINPLTAASSSTTIAAAQNALFTFCAAVRLTGVGLDYVVVGTGDGKLVAVNASTLATIWGPHSTGTTGFPSIGYYSYGGSSAGVFVVSYPQGSLGSATYTSSKAYVFALNAASSGLAYTFDWMFPLSKGVQWYISDNEQYFLQPFARAVAAPSTYLSPDGVIEDPSVVVVNLPLFAQVARYAVDDLYQIYQTTLYWSNSGQVIVSGNKLYGSYLTEYSLASIARYSPIRYGTLESAVGFPSRCAVVSLETKPYRFSTDSTGVPLSASSIPLRWDGKELYEAGFIFKPRIYVDEAGGSSTATWTGEYAFRVVYVFRDATGATYRSAPSLPYTITPAATKPRLWVQKAWGTRGVTNTIYSVEIYVADLGGDGLYYLQNYTAASTDTDGCWTYTSMEPPVSETALLYSTGLGGELLPAFPPPARDAVFIGSRMWLIDAQVRGRVLPSKLKQPNIAIEFAPELAIDLDGAAGGLVAISEFDGEPIVFAERGIFRISGDGPNNAGVGGFSPPRLVSSLGCADKHSVVRYPGGVLFVSSENKFATLTGQGVKNFEAINVEPILGAAVFPENEEVVYTTATRRVVYNWERDAWTTWQLYTSSPVLAVQDGDGDILTVSLTAGDLTADDSYSSTQQQSYTTGWVMPASDDQGDITIQDVVIQALRSGAHGLSLTAYVDYSAAAENTMSTSWSAADITSIADASGRYTVRWSLPKKNVRSILLTLTETGATGNAFNPISLTLVCQGAPGSKRRVIKTLAQK